MSLRIFLADDHEVVRLGLRTLLESAGGMAIVAECSVLAPRIRLSLLPSGTLDLPDLLDRGELDLVVSATDAPAERFASQVLVEDRYVAVMRQGHPAADGALDLSTFADLPQLAISSSGEDLRFVDTALALHRQSRSVVRSKEVGEGARASGGPPAVHPRRCG